MRGALRAWRRVYGASPLHLLVMLAAFALAIYTVAQLASNPSLTRMAIWFGGAVVAHDLVLFPAYASADRTLTTVVRRAGRRRRAFTVSPVNYVRLPVMGSGLLFVLFFPGIVEQGAATYHAATGQTQEPFAMRWVIVSACLFALAAAAYAVRLGFALFRERRRAR